LQTAPGEGHLSYLCSGWKLFFGHAVPKVARRRGSLPLAPT